MEVADTMDGPADGPDGCLDMKAFFQKVIGPTLHAFWKPKFVAHVRNHLNVVMHGRTDTPEITEGVPGLEDYFSTVPEATLWLRTRCNSIIKCADHIRKAG